jgi:hypothetical protein
MTDIVIKSDYEIPKAKRRRNPAKSDAGSVVNLLGKNGNVKYRSESAHSSQHTTQKIQSEEKNAITIDVSDPKTIKLNIVKNWEAYLDCPKKIVTIIRRLYPNTGTASSQLSNLKSVLEL